MRSVGDSKFRFVLYPAPTSAPKAATTGAAWTAPATKVAAAPSNAGTYFSGTKQMATVHGVTVIPVYQLRINP